MRKFRARTRRAIPIITFTVLLLAASIHAAVKAFNVTFYLANTPGGSEVTIFKKGETVYVYASPPPEGTTLVIEVRLIYPSEAGRTPIVLLARRTVRLSGTTLLTTHVIQDTDPEGTYAIRILVTDPATGDSRDVDLSFDVRSPIPWELIVPLIVVAAAGTAGFLVIRHRRLKQVTLVQAAPPAPPGFETQIVQPGTITIRAPTGGTMTLTAILQAGTQSIPITRLPQEFGRADFVNIAPKETINAISRKHFMIGYDYSQGTFYIQDLGSTNGTYVNGVDIRGKGLVPLKNGDRISVAGVLDLTFVSSPAGSSQPGELFTPGSA
jgi:hypothetical protein